MLVRDILAMMGISLTVVGAFRLIHATFQQSRGWGYTCFFFFPAYVLFFILHWDRSWKALLMYVTGIVLLLCVAQLLR